MLLQIDDSPVALLAYGTSVERKDRMPDQEPVQELNAHSTDGSLLSCHNCSDKQPLHGPRSAFRSEAGRTSTGSDSH